MLDIVGDLFELYDDARACKLYIYLNFISRMFPIFFILKSSHVFPCLGIQQLQNIKLSEPQKTPGFLGERKTLSIYRNLLTEHLCDLAENGINYKYNQMATYTLT